MDRERADIQLQNLTKDWEELGKDILVLETQRKLLKEYMGGILKSLGTNRYEDSKGNLWVLLRFGGTPWYVRYTPAESRKK